MWVRAGWVGVSLAFWMGVACDKKEAPKDVGKTATAAQPVAPSAPLRDKPVEPPPPPLQAGTSSIANVPGAAATDSVHEGPSDGADSPESLVRAFVDAAKKRDVKAFLALTVSGRDVALHFHKGLHVSLRAGLARLARKFATYTQQIAADADLAGFKAGLAVDFQKGQGATTASPGHLGSTFMVKAAGTTKTLPLGRIVRIDGRWKIFDF